MAWIDQAPKDYVEFAFEGMIDKAYIHKSATIGNVQIGRCSYINSGCVFAGKYPVRIGSFCSISNDVYCFTCESHQTRFPSTFPLRTVLGMDLAYSELVEKPQGVVIGNDVWIGHEVRLMPGLTIGDGCVIGARAVVVHDCEPYGIYAGVPARLIRKRFSDEIISQLLALRWWKWPLERIYRNKTFFDCDLSIFQGDLESLIVP